VLSALLSGQARAASVEARRDLRVLLVLDRAADPLMERIRAEVVALGLAVIARGPSGPLEADAREQHAVAAIRVLPSRKGVELWMADVTTGRTLARQLIVDERPQGPDHTLIALQTAEILRTSLFPQPSKPSPSPPPPQPPPQVIVLPAPRGPEGIVQAGFGSLYSSGGASSSLQVWASLGRRWRNGLGVALDVTGPVVPGSLSGLEGSAAVGGCLLGTELFVNFPPRGSKWFFTTGVGGGIADVWAKAKSRTPPLQMTSSSKVTGIGYARLQTGWKPVGWFRLSLAGVAGTTFETVRIRFAGNQAGTWGGMVLAGFLQLGVEWE
jgi:hypothetical protein